MHHRWVSQIALEHLVAMWTGVSIEIIAKLDTAVRTFLFEHILPFRVVLFESFVVVSVPEQGPPEVDRATNAASQATLTSICWGLAFCVLARRTISTPSLNSAVTLPGLASSGSEKLRPKLP